MNPGCGSVSARVVRPSARVSYDAGEVRRARVRARDGGVCARVGGTDHLDLSEETLIDLWISADYGTVVRS